MGMPLDIVFVRHGKSEANVWQEAEKEGRKLDRHEEIRMRPDWLHPLTSKGIEQALIARKWILENIGDINEKFVRYTSHFVRACQTAGYLGDENTEWRVDDRIHERDWGGYGRMSYDQRASVYPDTHHFKEISPLHTRFEGGESLLDVVSRLMSFLETVKRKWNDERVIVVTHGEVMSMVRYVLEKMSPETWYAVDKDESQKLRNCAILWYTRVNPEDPNDIRKYLGWRRIIHPDDPANSLFGGEWQELSDKTYMSGAELLASVDKVPRLVDDDGF